MNSKSKPIAGLIISYFVVALMLLDAVMKFVKPQILVDTMVGMGYNDQQMMITGFLGFFVTILYAIPRTSLIGAIFMTAYFGGAVASNFRVDNQLLTYVMLPVYLCVLSWAGLYLRSPALRKLLKER